MARARQCARLLRAQFRWAAEREPLLFAALAELDEPALRTGRKGPQTKSGQLCIPPEELLALNLAPGDVAVEPDLFALTCPLLTPIRFGNLDRFRRYHMAIR
jgi:hypothetical protein